jgi:hypothetical protein
MNKERQFFDNLQRGAAMKKEKREHVEETMEEKNARWAKLSKKAMSFAKQCGIDLRKLEAQRKKDYEEKNKYRRQSQFF